MYYYSVALPLNISQLYTYKSTTKLTKGCRVLVNFNNNFVTGFVWEEHKLSDKEKNSQYKEIYEIIEEKPLLSEELLSLAYWISNYYFCSLGTVISAMLPTAIQIQIVQEVRKIKETSDISDQLDEIETKILDILHFEHWESVDELKKELKGVPLHKLLEQLEEKEIIEIKRTYDAKIKKKFANFIIPNEEIKETPELTPKQTEAWQLIQDKLSQIDNPQNKALPLARVADHVSYAIIKALKEKQLIFVEPREVKEMEQDRSLSKKETTLTLSKEQEIAIDSVKKQLLQRKFMPFLLYGVTGSGKTEVYIRLIRETLALSRTALILVPEIALTPQMEERFYNAFGENIAILHSHRNERERWEEWKRIKKGDCRIVLGARSAIFAPLENIGIIIVDEEHEGSYKQDNNPRYNARDIAVMRGKQNKAAVLLGSATPSLESWQNALNNKYQLLQLTHRPLNIPMPVVSIVDLKEDDSENLISDILKTKILERLKRNEQIILLQNRRGYASYVLCTSCGHIHRCPNCDVSLIYHSSEHKLMCHYCGYSEALIRKCATCGSYILEYGSAGTQQLEKQLAILFPTARLLRMDADTVRGKESYNSMFQRMNEGTVDILFGTQMIAKGLDFAQVTLVGVINADNSLNIPDFRASERTFQLLTQVAGRSGRGDKKGEVVIQTYNPEHYAILTANKQDFDSFVSQELEN
ncbi:MAG: primosomal protein N', partial [Candidatus Cloacimonas sp.]|nr:primosomal protein N' [Candidatus Cloacimonadota bacterium]